MYFNYGETELNYLKSRDPKLGAAIDQIGYVYREVDTDLFSSVVHHIIGQQISTAAQRTIWKRIQNSLGAVNAAAISRITAQELQSYGISFRKADYIKDFSEKVITGKLQLEELYDKEDQEVIDILSSLKGIGVWTAEMILTFCMQRPDILSFGDLAIHRGMRMLYHHRTIDRKKFERYRRRYSPCGTVASLYLWAIAGGAIEGMRDYAPKKAAKQIPAK